MFGHIEPIQYTVIHVQALCVWKCRRLFWFSRVDNEAVVQIAILP